MKLLEVCVDSLASARAAKQGGADRLEFCSALAVGGLTPYADLLRQIKAELDLPVRCLMRPRAGDFLYTRDELELLCRQIETLRSAGADGFVIGALTPEGALDLPAMRMQSEEPTVENVTRPVTELRLYQPVAELLCLVSRGGGVFRIKEEIHTHLGVKSPFPPHRELKGKVRSLQGIVGQVVLQGNLLGKGSR